jgi:tetratricopeptide (TPR) repeat protein
VNRIVLLLALTGAAAHAQDSKAQALLDGSHFLRLKALVEPQFRAHPDDAHAAYLLSRAEGPLGNLDAAMKYAETAVALEPNNAAYHAQVASACGLMAQAAGLLKAFGYARRAKKELDTALELDPKNGDALFGLALYYNAAPQMLGGDKQKAIDLASALTKLDPVRGYLTQAKLATDRKDAQAEEHSYRRALSVDPRNYDALVRLATFYLTRDRSAAWQLAHEAIQVDPTQAEAWKVVVQLHVATQCWDELRSVLEQARAAVPDDLAPYYYAAAALAESGHFRHWAADFLDVYKKVQPEGNEPTLLDAEKVAKRLTGMTTRAGLP